MQNKFPGSCGCGTRVAAGGGLLSLVDDCWLVTCKRCQAAPASEKRAGPSASRRSPKKSGGATWRGKKKSGKRTWSGKPAGGRKRKAASRGVRKAKVTPDLNKEWTQISPEAERSFLDLDERHSRYIDLLDGRVLPCSAAYLQTEVDRRLAEQERDKRKEFDCCVRLAELEIYGHAGKSGVGLYVDLALAA